MVSMSLTEAVAIFVTANSAPGDTIVVSIIYNGEAKPSVKLKTKTFSEFQKTHIEATMDVTPYLPEKYRWKVPTPAGPENIEGYQSWREYVKLQLLPNIASITNAGVRLLKKEELI